jgi:hypothetical protein
VDDERLFDLRADRQAPVEGAQRVLVDHLHVPAQRRARPVSRGGSGLPAKCTEPDVGGTNPSTSAGRRLAAAGLADQAQRTTGPQGQRHAVDGAQHGGFGANQTLPVRTW